VHQTITRQHKPTTPIQLQHSSPEARSLLSQQYYAHGHIITTDDTQLHCSSTAADDSLTSRTVNQAKGDDQCIAAAQQFLQTQETTIRHYHYQLSQCQACYPERLQIISLSQYGILLMVVGLLRCARLCKSFNSGNQDFEKKPWQFRSFGNVLFL